MNLVRIQQEVEILKREFGYVGTNSDLVKLGKVEIKGTVYAGLVVKQVPVNPGRFGHKARVVSMLFLIPDRYPATPPVGVYLDRPYQAASSHFIQTAAHGAPTMVEQGWYWACHAMGGSFKTNSGWHPGSNPGQGHNLATCLAAARALVNL